MTTGRRVTLTAYADTSMARPHGHLMVHCDSCGQALYESDADPGHTECYCPLCEKITGCPRDLALA